MIFNKYILVSCCVILFLTISSASGQKINQFNKNKKRTGVWKKYYSNKRIRYVGQFQNGKEIGTFKYYDISSSRHPVIIKKYFKDSDSAYVEFYTLQAQLQSKGMMIRKKRVGKWTYFFPNGNIFSEEFYKEGLLDGWVKNYYKNGTVLSEVFYTKGKKNGLFKTYSDKGVLIEEVNYKENILHGPAKYFELNGNLKEEGEYRNGKRYGKWEFYIGGKKATVKEKRASKKINLKEMIKKNKG